MPLMRARVVKLMSGPNSAVKAATVVRVAIAHYIVRSDDGDQFLAQLRQAGPDAAALIPLLPEKGRFTLDLAPAAITLKA